MLSSIHPLGERARSNRFTITATAFIAASGAGGALLGALAALVGRAVSAAEPDPVAVLLIVAASSAAAFALDARLAGVQLPTVRRQVNDQWLGMYRGWVYGAGFGLQLGLGVVTVVTTAATYLTIVLAVLTPSAVGATAIGAAFGLVRGLAILPAARLSDARRLRAFHRRLAAGERVARIATLVWLAAVVFIAAAAAIVEARG